jgi:putative salt-induced outer membrane protein
MRGLVKIVMAGCLLLATANVFAQDEAVEEETKKWEGLGEFGFVNTTGNTESTALNMKLNFTYNAERWRHRFLATALMTSEDGIQDNERYTAEIQSDRHLNEKSWIFGVLRWDADKFGSYDPQVSLTAGYGRQLMKSEKHEMKGEIGAGYKKLEERVSDISTSEAIVRILLEDSWQVFKTTRWDNRLLVETGSSNTFTQFDTGLAVSMTEAFAVKLGWQMRNNSKIPPDDEHNTDTVTSINLVYNF